MRNTYKHTLFRFLFLRKGARGKGRKVAEISEWGPNGRGEKE